MNERIKELYNQCFVVLENQSPNTGFDFEKFAELIVRECLNVVENLSPGYEDYRDQIEDAFRRDCMEEIKHHFGVK
jgi:hypothetical protein